LRSLRTADDREMKQAVVAREMARKVLEQKKKNAEWQRKFQTERRRKLKEICEQDESCRKKLCLKSSVGRPSLNDTA